MAQLVAVKLSSRRSGRSSRSRPGSARTIHRTRRQQHSGSRNLGRSRFRRRLLARRPIELTGAIGSRPFDPWVVIDFEWLLFGPHLSRDMLKVDADTSPRRVPTPHRVGQDIGRLQVLNYVVVTTLPALETCAGLVFLRGPSDLDERLGRHAPTGR